jgi:hypothetical protein
MMVESVLKAGMRRMGASHDSIRDDDLEELVGHSMVSLRLFVEAERLPDLMIELAVLLEKDELPVAGPTTLS